MLTAIIILALLSLLVATEADPASPTAEPATDEPMRPGGRCCAGDKQTKPDRMAA